MVGTLDGDEVGSLMVVALQQQISKKEEERLIQNLRENGNEDGITPEQLPDLIKYNPSIAFECLLT
eukprot:UN25163